MTPSQAIAALDRQLSAHGESVALQRFPDGSDDPVSLPCRGFVRGYRADEIVGGIEQTDSKFILSPTPIAAASAWPGSAGGEPWPEIGDWLVIAGRRRRIEAVAAIRLADVVVRIEGQVKG
jgi:hypothetical protein